MNGFLKGYYGYKNLGDEILIFGVLNYMFKNFQIDHIYIEVDDIVWMESWISMNYSLMDFDKNKIVLIKKGTSVPSDYLKIFGGGEVLTDQRPFPHDGWNLLIKYPKDIIRKNFVLLGGIGTPRKVASKWLYNMLIKNAKNIVVREDKSYNICYPLNKNTSLYHDFAYDIVEKYKHNKVFSDGDKLLININSYIYNKDSIEKIIKFSEKYPDLKKYFFPFDMFNDINYYSELKQYIPDLLLYDWTKVSLYDTLEFMASSKGGIGARLHFLLILNWLGKEISPLAYQEKINKFFS